MKLKIFIPVIFVILILTSCSSAPKNTGEIYRLRLQAEEGMEVANKYASQGNFEQSLLLITDYKRMAILTDDFSLIIRCCLSRGNILFSLGRIEEAFAEWEQAISEAQKFKHNEFLSVSRVFRARGNLLSNRASAQSVLDEVTRESANIKSDKLFVAFSWQVRGLALRSLGSYREAEEAMKRSLTIHESEKSLENASFDWYTIASIRSLAGNTQGALQALDASIKLDRRVENSWGLAASWRAIGDVHRKTGNTREAMEAYQRSRNIYLAIGNEYEVLEIDKRMGN